MKSLTLSLIVLATMSIEAGSLTDTWADTTVDGYARIAYQSHDVKDDKRYQDDAIAGKLHIQTPSFYGLSASTSIYASTSISNEDNAGLVPFRGKETSYFIVAEAYLKANYANTILKIGRQEIESPFAQADDIGLVPNTFEALVIENKDIKDTTLTFGHLQSMSGVDAEIVDKFKRINGDNCMQMLGATYEGIENLTLALWHYNLKEAEIDQISYVEAMYEGSLSGYGYGLGIQYSKQGYSEGRAANVFGATASFSVTNAGLTFATAYNQSKDNAATSGFGGGPFFSNSEFLIIDNAGKEGKQTWVGVEFDASSIGVDGLTLGLGKATLENEAKQKATEVDFVASYEMNKNVEVHLIYSDLKATNVGEDEAKHFRMFANYSF